jgi:hypothetical protein
MKSHLLDRGRLKYIDLNRRFLKEVERGSSWEELHPLVEEMKSLAIYLQQIPTSIEELSVPEETKQASSEAADLEGSAV